MEMFFQVTVTASFHQNLDLEDRSSSLRIMITVPMNVIPDLDGTRRKQEFNGIWLKAIILSKQTHPKLIDDEKINCHSHTFPYNYPPFDNEINGWGTHHDLTKKWKSTTTYLPTMVV
ncbi:hypothetical protein QJS10_CPA10g00527 [Acorus calamus]|uniref:Uncharacterized protein n=1 Tax=Acorus calamus TaxID=4465 RepID=A0AAV9DZL4_ACOCL|nr:hypothetical protein QJS10_CPA10g00527 [Acorus calamus]